MKKQLIILFLLGYQITQAQNYISLKPAILSENPAGLTDNSTNITNPPIALVSGAGTRLMWIPSRSAFRVGSVYNFSSGNESSRWDAANIGLFSFASGVNTLANGNFSTSIGESNTASGGNSCSIGGYGNKSTGEYSTSMGHLTTASGERSTSMGYQTTAGGIRSTSMGSNTTASGFVSTSIGEFTTAQASHSVVLGRYNIINGTTGSWIATDPLFVIGNGTSNIAPNNALTVLKNANVGINIADPHAPLQFSNGLTNRKVVLYETGNNDHQFYGLGIQGNQFRYQVDGTSSNHVFYAATGAGTSNELCRIQGNGNMVVVGTVTASGSVLTSDIRLKKDFTRLNSSLSKLYKIDGYHYFWKDETKNKDLQTGVIAQEVEKIFPELVQTDDKGYKSVNYIGLIPHLIEAVKELRNENNDLKELKNENKELKNRLEKIEALLSASTQNAGK